MKARGSDSSFKHMPSTQWIMGALSPGINWPGHETHHSPPSGAQVKNKCGIPPLLFHEFMALTMTTLHFTQSDLIMVNLIT